MEDFETAFKGFMLVIGILCLIALILGLPLWILWNLVMPDVFALPHISFWQAVGMQLISALLFKDIYQSKQK